MNKRLIVSSRSLADIDLRSRETIGKGWGKLERFTLRHRRFDNSWSDEITRDVYTIGEVVTVLPYDPIHNTVLLVEQFRTCGLVWGEPTWLFEAVAGLRDEGETPEDVARREAMEEAGCSIDRLHSAATVWSSPGGYGERSFLFIAEASLDGAGGIHGLAEENEDTRAVVVPLPEAMAATLDGRIVDAKTILLIQWLAIHRDKMG